jgi:hypothetical protein
MVSSAFYITITTTITSMIAIPSIGYQVNRKGTACGNRNLVSLAIIAYRWVETPAEFWSHVFPR